MGPTGLSASSYQSALRRAHRRWPVLALALLLLMSSLAAIVAAAAPVHRGAATATGTATSLTLATPSSAGDGDLLLAHIVQDGRPPTTIEAPTGWSLIDRSAHGALVTQALYWRIHDGSPHQTWNFSAAVAALGAISAYGGTDDADPIGAVTVAIGGAAAGIKAKGATTDHDGSVVALFFSTATITTFTPPPGTTERYDHAHAAGIATMAADLVQARAGPTGTFIASPTVDAPDLAHLVVIRPASGGPSDPGGSSGNNTTTIVSPGGLDPNGTLFEVPGGNDSVPHIVNITVQSSGHAGPVTLTIRPLSSLPPGVRSPPLRSIFALWDITLTDANGTTVPFDNATILFFVPNATSDPCTGRCALRFVHWTGTTWEILRLSVHESVPNGTIFAATTTSFSPFAFGTLFPGGGGGGGGIASLPTAPLPVIPVQPLPGDATGADDGGDSPSSDGGAGAGAPSEGGVGDGTGPPLLGPDTFTPFLPWLLALTLALFVAVMARGGTGVFQRVGLADRARRIDTIAGRPWEARPRGSRHGGHTPVSATMRLLNIDAAHTPQPERLDALRLVIAHEARRIDRMFAQLRNDQAPLQSVAADLSAAILDEAGLLNRLFAEYHKNLAEDEGDAATAPGAGVSEGGVAVEVWMRGDGERADLTHAAQRFDRAVIGLKTGARLNLPEAPLLRLMATEEARNLARRFASQHADLERDEAARAVVHVEHAPAEPRLNGHHG